MRDHILSLVRPAVEQLAEQLTEIILCRVAVMVGQLELAFDVAASSFASDIDSATPASAVEDSPRPTKRSKRAATPGQGASSAAGNVAEPHRAPTRRQRSTDAGVATSSGRPCGCAWTGRHRKTCTLTSTSPASRDSASKTSGAVASTPATSLSSRTPPPCQPLGSLRRDRSRCACPPSRSRLTAIAN